LEGSFEQGGRVYLKILGSTALALGVSAASGQIVDIDSRGASYNTYSAAGTVGSYNGTFVGASLSLAAGDYLLTPLDIAAGGAYTAVNRFGSTTSDRGWEWSVWLQQGASQPVMYGFGVGAPPPMTGSYQSTAGAAFALAPAPFTFTLASATTLRVLWFDDHFGDNQGGISVRIAPVPEPSAIALLLAGLGVVGGAVRRRHAVASAG
jgi:hypothetical protein